MLISACAATVLSISSMNAIAGEERGGLLNLAAAVQADSASRESLAPASDELKISLQMQFRYNFNQRGSDSTTLASPDEDVTIGFVNRRTKIAIAGKVTDDISAKVQISFSDSSGSASLYDGYFKWKLSDTVVFRAGQFKPGLLREENLSSKYMLATDRSSANETLNQDYTQGVELRVTEDDWRFIASFNDGFSTKNTYFTSSSEADYGVTARGELKFGESTWKQYKQFTSWRGASGGLMIGAAAHHQSMGRTNPATNPTTDLTTFTVDASLLGDGWNLYSAGIWRSTNDGLTTFTDSGFILQGGVFVSDTDEFFARWDLIMPSDSTPVVVGTSGPSEFNTFTVGWNHYILPESHAAKFTLEVQHFPDPTTESIVTLKNNLLADSTSGQFAITAQFQLLF